MLSRRALLQAMIGFASLVGSRSLPAADEQNLLNHRVEELELRHGGRLGLAIRATESNLTFLNRGDERFLLCRTFKLLAAAFILSRVDDNRERLDRPINIDARDLVTYSPATEQHVGHAMTLGAICRAGLTLSDNTAANLMLASFGGPGALTAYIRQLGDDVTRLDRTEPELNEYAPGDPRDTTTPASMLGLTHTILLGNALSMSSRRQLEAWMRANETGDKRLRAGLPADWIVGDKTGSGDNNSANDVAVIRRDRGGPIIICAYYAGSDASRDERDRVLADTGRIAAGF